MNSAKEKEVKIREVIDDPAGKSKSLSLKLSDDELSKAMHWNRRARFKWTLCLFFGCMLVYAVRSSMSICVSKIGVELGWNKHVSGIVLSSFFAGYVTTQILGGHLADKYGGENIIFYGGLLWATMTFAIPIAARQPVMYFSNTVCVIIARFLTGVGQGFFFPSVSTVVTRRSAIADRALVYSTSSSGSSVGTILSGFLGSFLIESVGWPSVFIVVGALALLWLYGLRMLTFQLPDSRVMTPSKMYVNSKHGIPAVPRSSIPWLKLLSKPAIWALIFTHFCTGLCFYNFLSWLPVYFHDAFPDSKGWLFNVLPWMCSFFVSNFVGYFVQWLLNQGFSVTFCRKLCVFVAMSASGVFSLFLNYVETFPQALFLMCIILGLMSFGNCGTSQNSQDVAPSHAGALHGLVNMMGAFSGILGVYVTGHILESTGHWSSIFNLTSGVSFLGLIVFLLFGSGERIV